MSPVVRTLFFGDYALVVEQLMNVSCYVSILIFPFGYEKLSFEGCMWCHAFSSPPSFYAPGMLWCICMLRLRF